MSSTRSAADPPSAPAGTNHPQAERGAYGAWRWAAGVLLLPLLCVMLAFAALHWLILPHIDRWRSEVATRAGAAIGAQVRIGAIRVTDARWLPPLELRDVQVFDRQGVQVLRLPRVVARVSPRALWSGSLVLETLQIDGADLDIRRDAAGRLSVAGFVLDGKPSAGADDDGAATRWLLRQPHATLDHGTVRWTDALRPSAPLVLTQVRLEVRNSARRHDLTLQATPPATFGAPVTLQARYTQPFYAAPDNWSTWSGRTSIDWPQADLGAVAAWAASAPEAWAVRGQGTLRASVDTVRGTVHGVSVEAALRDLGLPALNGGDPLALAAVGGTFTVERNGARADVAARHVGVTFADGGASWPAGGDVALALRLASPGAPWAASSVVGGTLTAPAADLAVLARLALSLPLPPSARRLLADAAPAGAAQQVSIGWDGALAAPSRYKVKAALHDVRLAARAASEPTELGRPGVRGLSATVVATEQGGSAEVSVAAGSALQLPGVFEDAQLPVNQLGGTVAWQFAAPGSKDPAVAVQWSHGRVVTADTSADVDARWTPLPAGPGRLVLNARVGRLRADRLARYLPLGVPAASRLYVAHALRAGDLAQTSLRVDGDLRDFPFFRHHAPGEATFRLSTQFEHVVFAFSPTLPALGDAPAVESAWPALADVGGTLVMDRANVQWKGASARWAGYALTDVEGHVDDIAQQPVVEVHGHGHGPLTDLLGFVAATPLAAATGHVLERSVVGGDAALELALTVPLTSASSTTVTGAIDLAGNDLRMAPGTPLLGSTHGRIAFDEKGMSVIDARAQVLGGQLRFEGGNPGGGDLRFTGTGTASAEGLAGADELGWLARLSESLSGRADYRIALGFVHGQSELDVRSDLVGVDSALPAPLAKPAGAAWPLHYATALAPGASAASPHDTMRFDLGSVVQARYRRDLTDASPRVIAGAIGVRAPMPAVPASGVAARAVFPESLDIDAWTALGEHWAADSVSPDGAVPAAPAPGAASMPQPLLGGYAPTSLALQAAAVHADGRQIDHVQAAITQDAGWWHATLRSDQAQGRVDYHQPRPTGGAGRLEARLARLSLPESDAAQVEQLLARQPASAAAASRVPSDAANAPEAAPSSLPSLDITVDEFELRGKRLGRLEVLAHNRTTAAGSGEVGREWQLQRLSLVTPDAHLSATGRWLPPGGPSAAPSATLLDFKIDLADAGALLTRLGTPGAIAGGKGTFGGQVTWLGSPLSLDWPSMGGQLHLSVDDGRFLKVEPGAARLLGVLSLQALPRRLSLDFRDVFEQGYVFDNAIGDLRLDRGVATTNNLRMHGVQAAVLVEGSADIERETQALHVVVVPEISAGTASLAYAVINPAIGLGAFLAQLFLKKPLAQAGTREFAISGPWSDPKVERLARRSGSAAASASAASGAAPGNGDAGPGTGSSQ